MISALLADDSISELEMMLYLIKKENLPLQAATAEDGEQALQYIQHHFVDLLITDIRMPFLDGLALCRKALEINPEMKIIIISGYDEFSYAKAAISLNVTEYLLKPIQPLEFIRLLQSLICQIESQKGILLMIATTSQEESALFHLSSRISELARQFFSAPVTCSHLDHCLLLTVNRSYRCELPEHIKEETEGFLQQLQSIYLFPFYGTGIPIPKPEELLSAIREMKKSLSKPSYGTLIGEMNITNEKVLFVCDYIASHYQENIGINVLADAAYLHPDYLSRIFKKETGINLNYYIKTYRLNQACRLLENTQQKIVTISNLVGYPNCSYFIRSFMNHFGISPEKYRQQFKEAQNGGIE